METPVLIADIQSQSGESAVISFHDVELCTKKCSSEILGYFHSSCSDETIDAKYGKAVYKGHKVAMRAAELINHRHTEATMIRVTDSGLVGGSPCEGPARIAEGITWFEKVRFDFCIPGLKRFALTSTNYLHFSSPMAQIVPDDFYKGEFTIITGMCLFSARILQSSIPQGGPIDIEKLQYAGPTLYEVEYIARSAPVIADFLALLSRTSTPHQDHGRQLNLCLDIPSFHYYQSIDQRLRDGYCTFQQALQWMEAVEKRHEQIAGVFRRYINYKLSQRDILTREFEVRVSPSADWVCCILRQFLVKGVLPSLDSILHSLSTYDPIWAGFFCLIPEKEKPHDFKSFGHLFYVFQVVRPALVESNNITRNNEKARSSSIARTALRRLLIGIDDGVERRIYSRAQKVLKRMNALSSKYPVTFSLLEVYLCRRVFISRNQSGSNLYLDDPSPERPTMGVCTRLPPSRDMSDEAHAGLSHKLDPFDVISKLYGSSAGAVLERLFSEVKLGSQNGPRTQQFKQLDVCIARGSIESRTLVDSAVNISDSCCQSSQ
ncbi:MAG: hypothetical protein Q9191_004244 [Dirinaria sp. TL-2023a]